MDLDRFERQLGEFSSKCITILGDFILDEYLIGETKRVSREAPVIVIDHRESVYHPGGAANAAQNVGSLGAVPRAFGILGQDREGDILTEILEGRGADTRGLFRDSAVKTSVKTRILAGDLHAQKQQVARIDRTGKLPVSCQGLSNLEGMVDDMVKGADGILISDYGMGAAPTPISDRLITRCREAGIPVVVDSRFQLMAFRGATVATPNEVELFDAMNVGRRDPDALDSLAPRVIAKLELDGLIVTRGSHGMQVFGADGTNQPVGIVGTRDVTDVTGAGDTVAAAVALTLACGGSLVEAAVMATYAAAVVVMKRGTATARPEELRAVRAKQPSPDSRSEIP